MSETSKYPFILITRPEKQGQRTKVLLESHGFNVLLEPLLSAEPLAAYQELLPQTFNITGLVLTSANAVPALSCWAQDNEALLQLPVLTTGQATAQAAEEAGFCHVTSVQGSALDLVDGAASWIEASQQGVDPQLFYPCAEETAHDLTDLLAAQNINCHSLPVYRTREKQAFSETVIQAFDQGLIGTILLYSPRTARVFGVLMEQATGFTFDEAKHSFEILCLSQAILDALPPVLKTYGTAIERPDEALLLDQLLGQ